MVQLIGAGFGRTGTLSIKSALQRLLGGRCYHMAEVFTHQEHVSTWIAAARGDAVDYEALLHDYVATVDWPACAFWRELMVAFPTARVLLSVRPADQWYASYADTLHQIMTLPPDAVAVPAAMRELGEVVVQDRSFGPGYEFLGRAELIAAYERHNAAVRDEVPAERLLEFDVAEGWEPLCDFLGRPAPDEPFPRRNDRDQLRAAFGLS